MLSLQHRISNIRLQPKPIGAVGRLNELAANPIMAGVDMIDGESIMEMLAAIEVGEAPVVCLAANVNFLSHIDYALGPLIDLVIEQKLSIVDSHLVVTIDNPAMILHSERIRYLCKRFALVDYRFICEPAGDLADQTEIVRALVGI